jgi:hypothetical protein
MERRDQLDPPRPLGDPDMRKIAILITCGALALQTTAAVAQDYGRDDHRRDHYDHHDDNSRDDQRGGGRWGGGGEVILFEHDGFRGEARPLRGDAPDLSRLGFNDRVSSMRIARGTWEFCEHAYYQGKCWRYDDDMASLPKKQNDRYSSVRRVR